ncbi:unnamed protein product [Plutella xylostella]|uniref:(diamondback moth) hypothetical protein n=1 Tax=Plutella xylostella TaxID=51655 RepID=A0A8S4FZ73_PLUXY|nr:unnamed protein product [Plutella xylostella]
MPGKLPPEPRPPPLTTCSESARHYVNQTPPPRTPPTALLANHHTDIFDMQPFTAAPMSGTAAATPPPLAAPAQAALLANEPWFHGPISRTAAEKVTIWILRKGRNIPEPFTAAPLSGTAAATPPPLAAPAQAALLANEPWFHGPISRTAAEKLVTEEGSFLVRSSAACAGQYVLTGARRGQHKHLLLVDPNGVVRTKDRVFESVPHLIKYHCSNSLPIVSADSALLLKTPVPRDPR